MEGAGVKVIRMLNNRDVTDFDPFLMLDAFDSDNPDEYRKGFPWHPHRGIETITYLLEGEIEHTDSLGNKGSIRAGDCQWMTAGSGIIHQEMPQTHSPLRGLQVWLNLPKKDKMTHPAYRDIQAKDIPVLTQDGVDVRILSGEYGGIKAAMQADYVSARLLDISLQQEKEFVVPTFATHTVFVYVATGAIQCADAERVYAEKQVLLFSEGTQLVLKTKNETARVLFFEASPLHEPIAWGGPIVMNTREELADAFAELDKGTFIKQISNK